MPLFTNAADRDLPLLTWAFQVNSNNREELFIFLKRWPREYINLGVVEVSEATTIRGMSVPQLDKIDELGEMCRLAHDMMENLYDDSMVSYESLDALNSRLRRYQFYFDEPPRQQQQQVAVSLLTPSVKTTGTAGKSALLPFQPAGEILAELNLLVIKATAGVSPLLRCDECRSVFYSTRGGQRFCSYRCGNRFTVRENRAARKSKQQTA